MWIGACEKTREMLLYAKLILYFDKLINFEEKLLKQTGKNALLQQIEKELPKKSR